MQTTFIYGLICPKTNTIKYIGKADDIKRRFRQHIYQSKYSDNNKNDTRCIYIYSRSIH